VEGARGIDPYSSGRWFTGWTAPQPAPQSPSPAARALTWLGTKGWKRHGALSIAERPGRAQDV